MNIRNYNKINQVRKQEELRPLFESQQQVFNNGAGIISNSEQSQVDNQKLQTALTVKSKQFKFDCGAIMASIKFDTGNAFGLKYFSDKSADADEFVENIRKVIESTGEKLTDNDITRLKNEFNRK